MIDPAATERTTPSGVRLVDFAIGSGAPVGDGDTVSIDYTTGTTAARYGWKIDSTEGGWAGGPGRPPPPPRVHPQPAGGGGGGVVVPL